MPPKDPIVQVGQGLDARTSGAVALAIVSPCSKCKNRRYKQDKDGRPACPRMAHIQRKKEAEERGDSYDQFAHLALTGLEYNPFSKPSNGVLANPVYDVGRGSIYLWVARLVDNSGGVDAEGTLASPPITSPDFDTNDIVCMTYPVIPADTLVQYFAKGRIREGETLLITTFRDQQLLADGSEAVVNGVATRVALHGAFPLPSRPKKDDCPRGA